MQQILSTKGAMKILSDLILCILLKNLLNLQKNSKQIACVDPQLPHKR